MYFLQDISHILITCCDLARDTHIFTGLSHHLESLLIVDPSTTDEDRHLLREEFLFMVSECVYHSSKGLINMSKIRNSTSDDDILSLLVVCEHRADEGIRIGSSIFTVGIATGFTVVPDLLGISEVCEGIRDDNRGTAPTREEPDATVRIEDTELETRTSLTIELIDILLRFGLLRTERIGKNKVFPVLLLSVRFTGIDSCDHIETYNITHLIKGKWIDLKVSESVRYKKLIECGEKSENLRVFSESVKQLLRDPIQSIVRFWIASSLAMTGNQRNLHFLYRIPIFLYIYASFSGKIYHIVVALGLDSDIVLISMHHEWLNEKRRQFS